jgi:hypothetical protein
MTICPYRKVTEYHFTVDGVVIAVTEVGEDYVCVEETRKNGQEDCHMSGTLELDEAGKFVWSEGKGMFVDYASESLADGILDYLNMFGPPPVT